MARADSTRVPFEASGHREKLMFERLHGVIRSYAEVARSPRYFPLWLAQLVSAFGDTVNYIALVILIYQLTGSGAAVATLVAVEIGPALLLGPVAGVVIDRLSRKAVLIGADLFRAALVLTLVWPQGAWHVYAVAAGLVAGSVFFNPTVQAVIPALTTDEQRLAANSVTWSTGRLVQIVGSIVVGGLIALIGTQAAFAVNAASFVVSALLLTRLPIPAHAGQVEQTAKRGFRGYLADARTGLQYARRNRLVARLLVVQTLASLAVGATSALLVVLAERHLDLAPAEFAWLIGAIGLGALIGPLIPNALAKDYRDARWLFVPYLIRGVGDVLIAVITPLPLVLVILFVYGLNTSTGLVVFNATLQGVIPDAIRGRIFTLFDVSWNAMRLLSLAAGSLAAEAVGIQPVYWAGGALLATAGGLGLALLGSDDLRLNRGTPSP